MSELITPEDILLRQIHPLHVQNGRIGSPVFSPTENDEDKLSCSQKNLISEKNSHQTYTTVKNLKSCGIASVSISEVQITSLKAYSSPTTEGPSPAADTFDQAHAHIDFSTSTSKSDRRNKAKALAEKARQRKPTWFDADSSPIENPITAP